MNKFGRAVAILNRSGISARGRYKVRAHFPPTRYHIKALAAGCARRVAKLGGVRMLEVYIYAHGTRVEEAVPSGMELIRDPEAYSSCLELRCDDIDRDLVRVIEEGTLLDGSRFLDRFGVTLYTQQLSTGCKAALMVNNSDKVIDLRECGVNAISAILSLCKSGRVAMTAPATDLEDFTNGSRVTVNVMGRVFHSMREVDAFLRGEFYGDV